MNENRPSQSISITNLLALNGPGVYAWKRGDGYLYVGCCGNFLARLYQHNVIARTEPILESDEIVIWPVADHDEGLAFERYLIRTHKPKYNKNLIKTINKERGAVMSFLLQAHMKKSSFGEMERDAGLLIEQMEFDRYFKRLNGGA